MRSGSKIWNRFVRWFDRAFSEGWRRQVLFLAILLLACLGGWMLYAGGINGWKFTVDSLVRVLELMLDPGSFQGSADNVADSGLSVLAQFLITLCGAVLFTAMMITVIGNIVSNRINDFKKGRVRYDFDDHVLVLGANSMLVNMLKEFMKTNVHEGRKIVVLTTMDTEKLHDRVMSAVPGFEKKLDITWLNGSRVVEDTLRNVQIAEASSIYILGEDDEPDHDSINLATWNLVRRMCNDVKVKIECYLVVDRISTYHVLQFGKKMTDSHLHLNIINSLENWAQRVLVSREYDRARETGEAEMYPPIDGSDGISRDSDKTVRFVIFGMTQMGYAMASTVAHIAHYPNFCRDRSLKTVICFVAPDIREEMDFFTGHYDSLFRLSEAKHVWWNAEGKRMEEYVRKPDPAYGDFLDVRWEFIDSSIETEEMRALLVEWAGNEKEMLSVSICGNQAEENLAASLYMPYALYEKGSEVPVFVYQPSNGEVLRYAHKTERYANVYPFGMKDECYDPLFRRRIEKAKKINYLYHLENIGQKYDGMGTEAQLEECWNQQDRYIYRFSNLYAANSIPMKIRGIGLKPEALEPGVTLKDEQIRILAEVEHNRWNVERLLLGFAPVPKEDREYLKTILSSDDPEVVREARAIDKELKMQLFHKDIAPYDELIDKSRAYDMAIVTNILDVLR